MSAVLSKTLKLGLIGDNITRSKSPRLHATAGRLTGIDVTYDRLIPKDMGKSFDEVFDLAASSGFRGINVTYPYKERVTAKVVVPDPLVQAIGAVNTVVFDPAGPMGYNTDYTGFMQAYRDVLAGAEPGVACLIGTGGVGKAVAFGLMALKARTIRCVDLDETKAWALATALRSLDMDVAVEIHSDPVTAAQGADGIVNCTPLGMIGIGGSPLARPAMGDAKWAFDAVYTPVDTQFLTDARQSGLNVISGYELFFGQGVDAWQIFTGVDVDKTALRAAIEGNDL